MDKDPFLVLPTWPPTIVNVVSRHHPRREQHGTALTGELNRTSPNRHWSIHHAAFSAHRMVAARLSR